MELDEFFGVTPLLNILPDNNIQDQFDSRKKVYENRELFFELSTVEKKDSSNEEIQKLSESVIKAKELLVQELETYKKLCEQKNMIDEAEAFIKSVCIESKQKLCHLEYYFAKIDPTYSIKNNLETIINNIDTIVEIANQHVKNHNVSFKERVEKNNAQLAELSEIFGIIKHTNIGHVCPICLTNEINIFCNPCGHSFCKKCMTNTYCYICRTKVNKLHPMFFS
jgi:hypothetical protein